MNASADTSQMSAAPHTADVAELLAADRWDLAALAHEAACSNLPGTVDHAMAAALLDAPWDELGVTPTVIGAPHTADVAAMLSAGHVRAARDMHIAYATAELERSELGVDVNLRDVWMAGALLEAVCRPSD